MEIKIKPRKYQNQIIKLRMEWVGLYKVWQISTCTQYPPYMVLEKSEDPVPQKEVQHVFPEIKPGHVIIPKSEEEWLGREPMMNAVHGLLPGLLHAIQYTTCDIFWEAAPAPVQDRIELAFRFCDRISDKFFQEDLNYPLDYPRSGDVRSLQEFAVNACLLLAAYANSFFYSSLNKHDGEWLAITKQYKSMLTKIKGYVDTFMHCAYCKKHNKGCERYPECKNFKALKEALDEWIKQAATVQLKQ